MIMNASEAKEKTVKGQESLNEQARATLNELIKQACSNGRNNIQLDKLSYKLIDELKDLGYIVEIDYKSNSKYRVSWELPPHDSQD